MLPAHPASTALLRLVPALVGLALVAGCASGAEPGSSDSPRPSAAQSASSPAGPSESSGADEGTAAAQLPPGPRPRLLATLLRVRDLPAPTGTTWRKVRTQRREPATLAAPCHRFGLTSIGASRVVHRAFEPADASPLLLTHTVAQFADATTAQSTAEVLTAWREGCVRQLRDYRRVEVGRPETVETVAGDGSAYLLRYGPLGDDPSRSAHDATGVLLSGNRLVVLRVANFSVPRRTGTGATRAAVREGLATAAEALGGAR